MALRGDHIYKAGYKYLSVGQPVSQKMALVLVPGHTTLNCTKDGVAPMKSFL